MKLYIDDKLTELPEKALERMKNDFPHLFGENQRPLQITSTRGTGRDSVTGDLRGVSNTNYILKSTVPWIDDVGVPTEEEMKKQVYRTVTIHLANGQTTTSAGTLYNGNLLKKTGTFDVDRDPSLMYFFLYCSPQISGNKLTSAHAKKTRPYGRIVNSIEESISNNIVMLTKSKAIIYLGEYFDDQELSVLMTSFELPYGTSTTKSEKIATLCDLVSKGDVSVATAVVARYEELKKKSEKNEPKTPDNISEADKLAFVQKIVVERKLQYGKGSGEFYKMNPQKGGKIVVFNAKEFLALEVSPEEKEAQIAFYEAYQGNEILRGLVASV